MGHGPSFLGYHFGLGPPMKTQEKVLGWDVVMPRGVVGFEPLDLGNQSNLACMFSKGPYSNSVEKSSLLSKKKI